MGKCDAGSGVLFSARLLVSQSSLSPCVSQLRSDASCDASSGVVSPACLPVSPNLCGQMLDAMTPAVGSYLPLVCLCLPVSLPSLCG